MARCAAVLDSAAHDNGVQQRVTVWQRDSVTVWYGGAVWGLLQSTFSSVQFFLFVYDGKMTLLGERRGFG